MHTYVYIYKYIIYIYKYMLRMTLSDVEMVSADVALRGIAKGLGGEAVAVDTTPPCSIRDAYMHILHLYMRWCRRTLRCGALRKALAVRRPVHDIVMTNIIWCIAYKREVGRGVLHCSIIVQ